MNLSSLSPSTPDFNANAERADPVPSQHCPNRPSIQKKNKNHFFSTIILSSCTYIRKS